MRATPAILSIQSEVASGHVGNGAARFVLQRLGFDVFAVPTVLLAHHPGHGGFHGTIIAPKLMETLIDGLDRHGVLGDCAGVLTGYLGDPYHAEIAARAVARVKALNPAAVYLCDPVFGDEGGAYARPGVAAAMEKSLLPLADIATPNRFELEALTGMPVRASDEAKGAARALGPELVVATSIPLATDLATLAVTRAEALMTHAPRLAGVPNGTGDVLAALFLAHRLKGETIAEALQKSTASLHAIIADAVENGRRELPLIACQESLLGTAPPLPRVIL
ncbi:MAG: pyridoxal kinase [Alphaproteobacteria bacterium]|nr:pyridoxal kinase [Alphaproteobacteria bacterium]